MSTSITDTVPVSKLTLASAVTQLRGNAEQLRLVASAYAQVGQAEASVALSGSAGRTDDLADELMALAGEDVPRLAKQLDAMARAHAVGSG